MKTVARLSTRGSELDGDGTVDLNMGSGYREGTLKPNRIYEIRECLGMLTIHDMGPSAMVLDSATLKSHEKPANFWVESLDRIVLTRNRVLLTLKEYKEQQASIANGNMF